MGNSILRGKPSKASMKLPFFSCLIAVFLPLSLQARPFDDVIESGYLRVSVYEDYAPYSWEEDGVLKGIDVDIARRFAESLEVEIRFLVRGADESVDDDLRNNVWKGDLIHRQAADLMMHVPYDRELDARNEFVALMAPYFLEEMALVTNLGQLPTVETFGRFLNKPIAVELDTAGDFFLSNAFRGKLQPSIRRGRNFIDVVDLYNRGEVPAAMGSRAQAEWIAYQAKGIESAIVQPPMPGIVRRNWPIGLAVKHDSRDLGYALEDVVTELSASGEMEQIGNRYGVSWLFPR